MMPRLVLEVLDGRATVRARARIDAVPATIGRGYDNDVILDDPYACPTHVRITEDADGTLVAEDVGSVNGLRVGRNGARVPRVPLRHGTELRIGRTIVRCCDPAHPVPPALADDDQERGVAGRILASARWRVAAICASVPALVAFEYTASIDRAGGVKALSETVVLLLLLTLWSGGWALASRVVSHRFAFTRHFAYATLMAVAFTAFGAVTEWLDFLVPDTALSDAFGFGAAAVLVGMVIAGHLRIASTMSRAHRFRAVAAVLGALGVIGVILAIADNEKFTSVMRYDGQLKPIPASWVPAVSVTRFVADARALREAVDTLASDSAGSASR
ncbi:MAG: FHA domain-containing protein [Gemmatimonadaceae bacterium]|nr:FHA domain-containing protein [Gemmatimonadaceae bacterium]